MVTSVVLVDDHQVFADALAARLAQEPDLEVVATARGSVAARAALAEYEAKVALIDPWLGGEDGLDLVREFRQTHPNTRSVVVTGSSEVSLVVDAVRAGAYGWVSKAGNIDQLLTALRCAARGELWFEPPMLTRLVNLLLAGEAEQSRAQQLVASLTVRERDVLVCLAEGLSQAGTASRLFLSPNTVRTHRRNVLAKLGVHSSLEAVAAARRVGLVDACVNATSRG